MPTIGGFALQEMLRDEQLFLPLASRLVLDVGMEFCIGLLTIMKGRFPQDSKIACCDVTRNLRTPTL